MIVLVDDQSVGGGACGRPAISLSVGRTNPALHLYERAGFERIGDETDGPLRMRRCL